MTADMVTSIGRETVEVILLLSAPVLITGMVIGLAVSVFQAVTQIQESTLAFVPKIIGILVAALVFSSWMMDLIISYTSRIIINIPSYIG